MAIAVITLHDIVVLRRDALQPLAFGTADASAYWMPDADAARAALQAVGHTIPDQRLLQRLDNGLRLVRFDLDQVPVATSWVVGSPGRYIDEANWLLPIAAGDLWLRDVFVAPAWRGRRLFDQIVRLLAEPANAPRRRLWSDIDRSNRVSVRAHRASGFEPVARLRSLDVGGRLRLRGRLPSWPLAVREIDPGSRWVWLRGDTLTRHRQLIA